MARLEDVTWEGAIPAGSYADWQICIIGCNLFQNSLMASLVSEELGIPCSCRKTPDRELFESGPRFLVLFDGTGADPYAGAAELLGPVFENPVAGCVAAVFNSSRKADYRMQETLSHGVRGIFFENDSVEAVVRGIRAIMEGDQWFPRELLNRWIGEARRPAAGGPEEEKLTPREREILQLLSTGASNSEISGRLCVSYHTVKTHLSNIYRKINVSNRLQASLWSARNL